MHTPNFYHSLRSVSTHTVTGLVPTTANTATATLPLTAVLQLLLQVKLSSAAVHLFALVHPLILSKLSVEGAFLQPPQLQRKARSQLLQSGPCRSAFFSLDCSALASHTCLQCFFIYLFIVVVVIRVMAASAGTAVVVSDMM
jgi:hypothetical protein